MNFTENLVEELMKKNLSDSSIKLYLRNLKKLNDDKDIKNLKFLENIEGIVNSLSKYQPNTIRNYLISIVSVLSVFDNKKLIKLRNRYYTLMNDKNKEIKESTNDGEMNDKQKKNWITEEEIHKKFEEIEKQVLSFLKSKEISENQYNVLLNYIVLGLYVFMKPRRNQDYQLCNIIKLYSNSYDNDVNYLSYDSNDFIFNVYKTAKVKGQKIIKFDEKMKEVITNYIKFHPKVLGKRNIKKTLNTPFLVKYDGSPFEVNTITNILNRIFKRHIGSSMLRHIYHSTKYAGMMEEMREDADDMGHTVETVIKDYIKTPNKIIVAFK
jgi:hypothetical protein